VSSGAWIRTAAEALTAVAAVAGAAVGGTWAYFRYRREAPDVPRVDAVVSATLFSDADADYLAIDVKLRHLEGGSLKIERDEGFETPRPVVDIERLAADPTLGALDPILMTTVEVLREHAELDSGESLTDHKVVSVGAREVRTIGYRVALRFVAGWNDKYWTWCTNVVVRVEGPDSATGATVGSAPS
jgi:hypothetical protein